MPFLENHSKTRDEKGLESEVAQGPTLWSCHCSVSPSISNAEVACLPASPALGTPGDSSHQLLSTHCECGGGHRNKWPRTHSGNLPVGSSDTLEGVQSWRERDQVHGRESGPGLAQEDSRPCTLALRTGCDGEASSLGRSPRGSSYGPRPPCRTALPSAGSGSSRPVGSPRGSGGL